MNNKIKTLLCFDFILYHINTFSVAMTQKCRNCENIICASVNTRGSSAGKRWEQIIQTGRKAAHSCAPISLFRRKHKACESCTAHFRRTRVLHGSVKVKTQTNAPPAAAAESNSFIVNTKVTSRACSGSPTFAGSLDESSDVIGQTAATIT